MRGLLLAILFAASANAQFQIVFDYSRDTQGFFTGANSGRQAYLQAAGDYVSSILSPTALAAINPSGSNTWNPSISNPGSGASESLGSISISLNTVLIYAGARELGTSTLGIGGPGGFSANGSQSWFSTINFRGNQPYDMSWGGSLTFDITTSWYFDSDITTVESFAGKHDFFSIAVHEIGHVLGFGTTNAWNSLVNTSSGAGFFTGTRSKAAYGASVPLASGYGHWAANTMSTVFGKGTVQEALMDPNIGTNTRKYLTVLDAAGLSDIGYTAVPEPSTLALICIGAALVFARTRMRC